jgi:alkane 1-monooxygenase
MFPLSYVPALWFRVMDPRLLALPQVQGDLHRVNVDPRRLAALSARYGQCRELPQAP